MKKGLIVKWLTDYEQLLVFSHGINFTFLVTIPELHFYSHKNEFCDLCLLGKSLLEKGIKRGQNDSTLKIITKKVKRFLEKLFFTNSNNKDILITIARFYLTLGPNSYNNSYYILSKIVKSKCNFFELLKIKSLQLINTEGSLNIKLVQIPKMSNVLMFLILYMISKFINFKNY